MIEGKGPSEDPVPLQHRRNNKKIGSHKLNLLLEFNLIKRRSRKSNLEWLGVQK
jgi:hypothetical protein